jgi:polysaccharide biosynthesis/export protein
MYMGFMRIFIFFSIILSFLLVGCSTTYQGKDIYGADEFVLDSYKIKQGKFAILEMEGDQNDDLSDELLAEYEDVIHEGDILNIAIYHPQREDIAAVIAQLSASVGYQVVDGVINLPNLGSVKVDGLTIAKARKTIENDYLEQIDDVEVFISYKNRTIRKVELAGLVNLNSVPANGSIRLFDVLSQAKVPPEANLFKSYVMRDKRMLPVDLNKLLKEGDMSQNIVMKGGDKIYIAETSAASLMVMGEVGVECVLSLPSGSMSLRQALASARGIPYTGDKAYIQVIRGNIAKPKIYVLNWEHVIHLPNNSLLLMPGDIVYVASKPITEWNRFISQLLPSFTGIEVAGKGFQNVGIFIP